MNLARKLNSQIKWVRPIYLTVIQMLYKRNYFEMFFFLLQNVKESWAEYARYGSTLCLRYLSPMEIKIVKIIKITVGLTHFKNNFNSDEFGREATATGATAITFAASAPDVIAVAVVTAVAVYCCCCCCYCCG